ncbi:hypothetical protein I315_03353 [Cryptococcus gattii Ru294]|nr:hypothetical protein I315_03353 [Cryptococcus gattii Ru294]
MLAMTSVGQSNSLIDWLDKAQFGQDVDVLTGRRRRAPPRYLWVIHRLFSFSASEE